MSGSVGRARSARSVPRSQSCGGWEWTDVVLACNHVDNSILRARNSWTPSMCNRRAPAWQLLVFLWQYAKLQFRPLLRARGLGGALSHLSLYLSASRPRDLCTCVHHSIVSSSSDNLSQRLNTEQRGDSTNEQATPHHAHAPQPPPTPPELPSFAPWISSSGRHWRTCGERYDGRSTQWPTVTLPTPHLLIHPTHSFFIPSHGDTPQHSIHLYTVTVSFLPHPCRVFGAPLRPVRPLNIVFVVGASPTL